MEILVFEGTMVHLVVVRMELHMVVSLWLYLQYCIFELSSSVIILCMLSNVDKFSLSNLCALTCLSEPMKCVELKVVDNSGLK